jgi:glycosyltransferase involved in cell wall biosynthesis
MRVLMMTWEYPPRIVGGISRHVEELSWALAERGVDVQVVTCAIGDAPADEVVRGVSVHRVHAYAPANDFVHWVQQLNAAMFDRAVGLLDADQEVVSAPRRAGDDRAVLIHAHDWVSHFSAARLKHAYRLPMVGTIHATEYGRNWGIHTDQQRYIASVEQELTTEAWRVIVCSDYMKHECEQALGTPWDKMDVIPNGINADKFEFDFPDHEASAFRSLFAAPEEFLIMFTGRMVHEKGAHLLLEATRRLRAEMLPVKLVIVGGGHRQHLVDLANALGVAQNVFFTGFLPDDSLLRLYRVADAACYPSLYEPFGIVALEAMAAGTPVIVSDAGGLKEIVRHDQTGTVVWSGNLDSLVWGIRRVLTDRGHARWMAGNAWHEVRANYNWGRIADQTLAVYRRVWGEYLTSPWSDR